MISHQEAEVLISARQDAPLDSIVERELQAHLATCDSCRSFAIATEKLTAGVRQMPNIAPNPRIRREVMGRVQAGHNPLAGILGGISGGLQPGPAIAAVALIAVIGIFGWFAIDRLFSEDDGGNNQQLAA